MDKFFPLDLRGCATSGPALLSPTAARANLNGFSYGRCRFWGIPFDLVDPAENNGLCWVALSTTAGGGTTAQATLTLPTPLAAGGLVVAHTTEVEGPRAQVGELLATYTLHFANGERLAFPIRRRFEIAARQPAIGTQGFATVPQTELRPMRHHGPGSEGLYGMVMGGAPQTYWLWGTELPTGAVVTALTLEACSPDFILVGGLTLAAAQSHPLRRSARTAVRIELPPLGATSAAAPKQPASGYTPAPEVVAVTGEISLSVDQGHIVRITPATDPTPETWLGAAVQGWGEAMPVQPASAVYAEIYAAEGADLTVRRGDEQWQVPWQAVLAGQTAGGAGQVRITAAHPHEARLQVRVIDEVTGREMPARVHFRGASGEYLPPHGHTADVNSNWGEHLGGDLRLGATSYAYVPGSFEASLPVGQVFAEVVRGFEYTPLRQVLDIAPGQTELRLPLRRWTDARWNDFYSGDVHVHFLDPATAALEAAAEDLRVTNVLAVQWGRSFTNVAHGIGTVAASSTPEHLIRVDSENRHHIMGHLFLLGMREPIHPISSGGPTEDDLGGWEATALADWCDACRAQGGLVATQFMPTPHAEVVADILLGKIDAVEVRWFDFITPPGGHWGETPFDFPGVGQWYRYLNCGYRLPAVGGTDKMSNTTAIGALRTYARLPAGDPFSYAAWSEAIRQGRTFSSSGPLIDLHIEGQGPGAELSLPAGGGRLHVTATAQSAQPFDFLEIVQSGQMVARVAADPGGRSATLNEHLRVENSAWLAARCYGRGKLLTRWPIDVAAHTSPVYVTVGGQRQTSNEDASYLLTLMEGGLAYLDSLAAWRSDAQRRHQRGIFDAGREALQHHHPHARPHWHPPGA